MIRTLRSSSVSILGLGRSGLLVVPVAPVVAAGSAVRLRRLLRLGFARSLDVGAWALRRRGAGTVGRINSRINRDCAGVCLPWRMRRRLRNRDRDQMEYRRIPAVSQRVFVHGLGVRCQH
jgi:hypothetical protein